MQSLLARDKNFWLHAQWAATVSFLILMLVPVLPAAAQKAVVRDLCSSLAATHVAAPEITTIDRCNLWAPNGVRYNPEIDAKVRHQYEESLIFANHVTKEKLISNVILNATPDITTPPPIYYYREGDRVPYATYNTVEPCVQARQQAGGRCIQNDGEIIISLTGDISNKNPFPVSSVTIQCDYRDALDLPQSVAKQFSYTLAPKGGRVTYQDQVIEVLKAHSVVNDLSCKVQTAEIWQNTDNIQYLNAPLNPPLASAPSAPPASSAP